MLSLVGWAEYKEIDGVKVITKFNLEYVTIDKESIEGISNAKV